MTKPAYLCRRRLQCKQMGCSCRKSCRVSPRIDPGSGRGNRSCCSDPDIRPEPRGWSSLSPPGPAWHRSAAESEYNPESPSAWTQCLLQTHRGSTSTSADRKTSCLISLSKATHAIPIIFFVINADDFWKHRFKLDNSSKNKCRPFIQSLFTTCRDEWKANHTISVIKRGGDADWYLIIILIAENTLRLQRICRSPHTGVLKWRGDETRWNTNWQVKYSCSWLFCLSAKHLLIVDLRKFGELSI